MKPYMVIKQLYNERAKRVLEPGELIDFDDDQAAILMELACIAPMHEGQMTRAGRRGQVNDPQLDKLKDTDL